jgi:hypothetical protein
MKQLRLLSLASLGIALATMVAPNAEAQGRNSRVVVCRDGTRFDSDNASVCNRHNGVDGRATEIARRDDRVTDRRDRRDGRWDDRRDRRDDRRDQRDDRRDQRDDRNGDPRYGNNGNNGGYGNGGYVNGRSPVYQFQGVVDKEITIQLRGNRSSFQAGNEVDNRAGRSGRIVNGLPNQEGTLVIERLAGRGNVDVIEQPSSRNGYTATLRVRDPQGGADSYRFVAYFQPSGNGRINDGRYGRN